MQIYHRIWFITISPSLQTRTHKHTPFFYQFYRSIFKCTFFRLNFIDFPIYCSREVINSLFVITARIYFASLFSKDCFIFSPSGLFLFFFFKAKMKTFTRKKMGNKWNCLIWVWTIFSLSSINSNLIDSVDKR